MWNAVFDSIPGTSHTESGTPCQDACRLKVVGHPGDDVLIAVCADGAGSADHSEVGATIACDVFVDLADRAVESPGFHHEFTKTEALQWCETIRCVLLDRAVEMEVPVRELACTLLGAVIGESAAFFLQIGDGAMVISKGAEYEPVFWPQSGEYANMTNFLTDPEFEQSLEFCLKDSRILEFAAFTDGLERLALQFVDKTVHAPFLAPLLDAVANADDVDEYFGLLRQFLNSETLNERTNDDKTLILATRVGRSSDAQDAS